MLTVPCLYGSHGSGNNINSENSFAYQKRKIDNDTMNKAIDFIRNKIKEAKKPAGTTAALSPADELKKFKDLMDGGIISQDEFNEKKKQLLGL